MAYEIIAYKILAVLSIGGAAFFFGQHFSGKWIDWVRFQSIGTRDYIRERLAAMYIDWPPHKILAAQIGISAGLGLMILFMLLPEFVPGLVFGVIGAALGWTLPRPLVDWLYRRRIQKFVVQMIDGLSLMSNGLKSGLSIVQAIDLVTREMPDPISQELKLVLNQNRLGMSLEEAFVNLSKRVVADDVEMFVTSINILKETGGNLAETFDTIVSTLRERIKVERKIDAMTAQMRMQARMVMAVPPCLALYFTVNDPDMMRPLYTSMVGWMILCAVVALELVGYFVTMRLMKIDI